MRAKVIKTACVLEQDSSRLDSSSGRPTHFLQIVASIHTVCPIAQAARQILLNQFSTRRTRSVSITMHSVIFAIAGFSAMIVNAQATQNIATTTESLTPFQSTQATCLSHCHEMDNDCRTKCIQASTSDSKKKRERLTASQCGLKRQRLTLARSRAGV